MDGWDWLSLNSLTIRSPQSGANKGWRLGLGTGQPLETANSSYVVEKIIEKIIDTGIKILCNFVQYKRRVKKDKTFPICKIMII